MTTDLLKTEVNRALAYGSFKGTFTKEDGTQVQGATESDVKTHLTTTKAGCYAAGREHRFPGIGGFGFETALEDAGFEIITATNRRGQQARVVVVAG